MLFHFISYQSKYCILQAEWQFWGYFNGTNYHIITEQIYDQQFPHQTCTSYSQPTSYKNINNLNNYIVLFIYFNVGKLLCSLLNILIYCLLNNFLCSIKKKKNLIMYLTTDILYPTLHLSSKWRIPVTLAILMFADFILILLQYMSKGYIIWFSSFIFFTVYNKRTEWGSCSSWNWKKKKAFCPLLLLPAWLLTH